MFGRLSLLIRIILGKIIMKVLSIPGLKKWFLSVVYLYERELIKNECDKLNQKPPVGQLNFNHYLPDTEERIERLRQVINGRPVAIILLGPSVAELEHRITKLRDCDICYFGLNVFAAPEKHILQKINRTYSVFMLSGIPRPGEHLAMNDAQAFVERREDNMFISDTVTFHPLLMTMTHGISPDEYIKKYDEKLLFFTGVPAISLTIGNGVVLPVPSVEYPLHFLAQSSFSMLLSLALIGGASMVAVFGGDGGRINTPELHYRGSGSQVALESEVEESLSFETKMFNVTMPVILEKIYKIYNLEPVDIINCSLQSNYTPLRKLSYDDTFALLKSFKKVTA